MPFSLRITLCLATVLFLSSGILCAQDCSNLPTQFTGNEFPSGDFISNFNNPCYYVNGTDPGGVGSKDGGDLNATYWKLWYKVDPRYQLIILGTFPNARYLSVTAYDDHGSISQSILDANIVPLTSAYVNPYRPGVAFVPNQPYMVPVNFGGKPGVPETGCAMTGYNVDMNGLDATQRHQGMNWNVEPGVPVTYPLHNVDTPQHSNPPAAGFVVIRAYVDITPLSKTTSPHIIVRDVASGCAYPAAYASQVLQIVTTNKNTAAPWLDATQAAYHTNYANIQPLLCYGNDSRNVLTWARKSEFAYGQDPNDAYVVATVPAGLPATLAAAGEVMRLRLRIPKTPPTPCAAGCLRSGNEQERYMSLSFIPPFPQPILAGLADTNFVTDANGYATLIVGTGAQIPSWVTPANGYTFLDLTSKPGYQSLYQILDRNVLPATNFSCSAQLVPYNTAVYAPQGGMMGDYLPVVDYPLAYSLPGAASPLIGPNMCGILPGGLPAAAPNCAVLPANPITIASIVAPAPGLPQIAAQPLPPIAIQGEGFGSLPNGLPFVGNSNYLKITNFTQNWSAGYTGNPCGVSISNWADNSIEFVANVNDGGPCVLAAGDQLAISVWNPQTMAPVTTTFPVSTAAGYGLGAYSALVGSGPGSGSVLLVAGGPWTATSNASWLSVSPMGQPGMGTELIGFTYSANSGADARIGTLTIAGLTFTVSQAGAGYMPTAVVSTVSSGLNNPQGVALDAQGDLYIADTGNNVIREWNATTQQVSVVVSRGLNNPAGVAVDHYGTIYINDTGNGAIEQWNGQQLNALVTGLSSPSGIATDTQGSVYFSNTGQNGIGEWSAASQQATTIIPAGLSNPSGVAVDGQGNVYFADTANNAIKQWNPVSQRVTTLVASGLNGPTGVAVDGLGNIYFTDTGNNAVKRWSAASQQVVALLSAGLSGPAGLAVDRQGNLYIADANNGAIRKLTLSYISLSAATRTESAQAGTDSVNLSVLPANAPFTSRSDQPWLAITNAGGGTIAFSYQANPSAVNRTAHIAVLGQQITVIQSGDSPAAITATSGDGQSAVVGQSYSALLQVTVTDAAGLPLQGAAVTFNVSPGASGAAGTFAANPAMPILTNGNGQASSPVLTANNIAGSFTVVASLNGLNTTFSPTNVANAAASLGASSLLVGNNAGSGSVMLSATGRWTATSNVPWLQLAPGSNSGSGNSIIHFNYGTNTNPGAQTGILTIAGLTFTVTQAGASYTPATLITTLASGLNNPQEVALDAQGNVYIADTGNNAIRQWSAATQQMAVVSGGLKNPAGVAVDQYKNIYIADTGNSAIEQWNMAGQQLNTLVPGLSSPTGVAIDWQANIYFSNTGQNAIAEWNAASRQLTTLIAKGLNSPTGVAVDGQGNVYFADTANNAIKQWNPVNQRVTTLVASGLNGPTGVAADGMGNVYFTDTGNNAVKQWNAATQQVVTRLSAGLNGPAGLAVDGQGNLYVADANNGAIRIVTLAYVSLSAVARGETAQAGADSVTALVLPARTPLTATSDQPWLAISSVSGGVIGFSYQANPSVIARTAHIDVLNQQITVTQSGDFPAAMTITGGDGQSAAVGQAYSVPLAVTVTDAAGLSVQGVPVTFTVAPGASGAAASFAASSSMPALTNANGQAASPVLTANTVNGPFTVVASVNGLAQTFDLTNQSYAFQAASTLVGSNAGAGSVLLTATGRWTAASNASWLQLAPGSSSGAGSARLQYSYASNPNAASRTAAVTVSGLTFTLTQIGTSYTPFSLVQTLVSSGLAHPQAVAVDSQDNIYLADSTNNAVWEWNAASQQVSALVASGLNAPQGVAVDGQGNVYIADSGNNAIKEWHVANQQVTVLASSSLSFPSGVAVDSQGNVYFSDSRHNAINEWVASTQQVITLVSSGLSMPQGVTVDALGNVYFADSKNNSVKEKPVGQAAVTLVCAGLNKPAGVAVDGLGNVYIADAANNAIEQWSPSTGQVTAVVNSQLSNPSGVAVDGQGNIYIADTGHNVIKKFTAGNLALGATSMNEGAAAGADSVTAVTLPANLPLTAKSSANWLTVTGSTGGAVTFSFPANTSTASRAAQIAILNQTVTVTQSGDAPGIINITTGNKQFTPPGTAFGKALGVNVKDAAGNNLNGASVTFTVTPGPTGASGAFASSAAVITGGAGFAAASTLTANGTTGSFTVTATTGNVSAVFQLNIK